MAYDTYRVQCGIYPHSGYHHPDGCCRNREGCNIYRYAAILILTDAITIVIHAIWIGIVTIPILMDAISIVTDAIPILIAAIMILMDAIEIQ